MFDFLYEWIQNLAFYLVMVTAALHAVPGENYKKYIRFFTGLVLILMMLTPLFKIFGADLDIEGLYNKEEYGRRLEEFTQDVQKADLLEGGAQEEETGKVEVEEIRID